jgi:hypothetical protein
LIIGISVVVVMGLAVAGFFYLQVKRSARDQEEQAKAADKSNWGTCAKCRQRRVIVDKETGLCAYCWSSMRTKPLA